MRTVDIAAITVVIVIILLIAVAAFFALYHPPQNLPTNYGTIYPAFVFGDRSWQGADSTNFDNVTFTYGNNQQYTGWIIFTCTFYQGANYLQFRIIPYADKTPDNYTAFVGFKFPPLADQIYKVVPSIPGC